MVRIFIAIDQHSRWLDVHKPYLLVSKCDIDFCRELIGFENWDKKVDICNGNWSFFDIDEETYAWFRLKII